jgi:hypothetical protein
VGTNHFNYIAKWNGSSWSGLGSGMSSPVYALAVSGTNLYAAGDFFQAGGNTANKTAKWDGSTWSALGSGLSDSINALAVSGTNLYAGGNGPTNIATWDGSSWSTLGSGLGGFNPTIVWALVVSGGDVYAGGRFTAAGGNPAGYIAKWNGTSWSALGSGMGGATTRNVMALAVSGSELYAGGNFTTAGGKVSQYLARAYLIAPPGGVVDSIVESNGNATLKFYGNPVHLFDVLRTTDLTSPITWTTLTTNPLSPAADGSFTFTDTDAPPRNAYYRSVER